MTNALSGKSRLKTKVAREIFICRRLLMIKDVISEWGLSLEFHFVTSSENKAAALTKVPKKWLASAAIQPVCGAVSDDEIANIHSTSEHPGVKSTLYFYKRFFPVVTRAKVRRVVRN